MPTLSSGQYRGRPGNGLNLATDWFSGDPQPDRSRRLAAGASHLTILSDSLPTIGVGYQGFRSKYFRWFEDHRLQIEFPYPWWE